MEEFDDSISHDEDGEFENDNNKQGYEGSFSSGSFSQDDTHDDDDDDDDDDYDYDYDEGCWRM